MTLDEYLELVHQTKEEHMKQIEENAKKNMADCAQQVMALWNIKMM